MAYLTQAELEARVGGTATLIELTDDGGNGVPDGEVIAALLGGVDAEANGYFRAGGYSIPISTAQLAAVRNALLDLANYRAYTRGGRRASEDDRRLYEDALRVLRDVASRTILLDVPSAIVAAGDYTIDSEDPLFSRSTLRYM